jgi:hypothetical protein
MPKLFGPWLVLGSGKPDTRCERMHAENLTRDRDWLEPALDPVCGLFVEPHAAIVSAQAMTGNAAQKAR